MKWANERKARGSGVCPRLPWHVQPACCSKVMWKRTGSGLVTVGRANVKGKRQLWVLCDIQHIGMRGDTTPACGVFVTLDIFFVIGASRTLFYWLFMRYSANCSVCFVFEKGSLCCPDCPGAPYVGCPVCFPRTGSKDPSPSPAFQLIFLSVLVTYTLPYVTSSS